MTKKVLQFIAGVAVYAAIFAGIAAAVLWATAPEQWYAGTHDSQCETAGYGDCDCYNRLVAAAKAREAKRRGN